MATPSRSDKMVQNFMSFNKKEMNKKTNGCNKQFPDCPTEPNDKDCKTCPMYKK